MIKKIILAMLCLIVSSEAFAITDGLKEVCGRVRKLKGGEIYKSIGSPHVEAERRNSTSFITRAGTEQPDFDCLKGYNRKGKLIHKLGVYARNDGSYSSRFYGGTGCGDRKRPADIAKQAVKQTGKPAIFLKVKRRTCVRIPHANQCYNSSGC
jgi:hypothetical protein